MINTEIVNKYSFAIPFYIDQSLKKTDLIIKKFINSL
jgi:hypothetical protein